MDSKLTLKLVSKAIEAAKRYAEKRGVSLSRMVEGYFLRLAVAESNEDEPTGVLAELAGAFSGLEIGDSKEAYTEYLSKKYS